MSALLEAEKALRETHFKHRDKFLDVWGTKQQEKPWAIFVTEGSLKMMRTFESREKAREYATEMKEKHRLATVSAPRNIYGKNITEDSKKEMAAVNTTNIFFSRPKAESADARRSKEVARPKKEKKVDIKKLNYSLGL